MMPRPAHSDSPRCPHQPSTPLPGGFDASWDLPSQASILNSPAAPHLPLDEAARQAWRNSVRCIGRLHWKSLRTIDARSLTSPDEVIDALRHHLATATRGGRITPLITVFAPWSDAASEVRVWNHQLLRYAAYQAADGTILGDPMNLALTRVALDLGWRPPASPTRFDLLPVIVQCQGRLTLFEWKKSEVLEVTIRHPEHPWLESLGLRWYAVPALSDRILATGREAFPCAPFNGWYMGTEVAARDLADAHRYDQLPVLAHHMGLDPRKSHPLWRDRALVLLNEAVLWSFEQDGVRLVDHHQASREFIQFCDQESAAGRQPNADWSWIVPPISGSTTPVFHRTYPLEGLLPNFLSQPPPWETPRGGDLLARHAAPPR
jgi:nitric-oxide synthase, bacterial